MYYAQIRKSDGLCLAVVEPAGPLVDTDTIEMKTLSTYDSEKVGWTWNGSAWVAPS